MNLNSLATYFFKDLIEGITLKHKSKSFRSQFPLFWGRIYMLDSYVNMKHNLISAKHRSFLRINLSWR